MFRNAKFLLYFSAKFFFLTGLIIHDPLIAQTFEGIKGEKKMLLDVSFENDCVGESNKLIDSVIYAANQIGLACERQNEQMRQGKSGSCPTNMCLSQYEVGGLQAPSMELRVQNGTGSTSFGFGSFGSSTGTSRRNADLIFVTVSIKMNLRRDPDKIVCVNPLSPASIDRIHQEILDLNKRTNHCANG